MRFGQVLGLALGLSAVPVTALLLLALAGQATPLPAIIAGAMTFASLFFYARGWARDVALLAESVRLAANGAGEHLTAAPASAALDRITREVERLSRILLARAEMLDRVRRADNAIVERLPDPLIVLGPDRAIRRVNVAARAAFGADLPSVLRHPTLLAALDRAYTAGPPGGTPETVPVRVPVPVPRDVNATVLMLDPPLADGGTALVVLADQTEARAAERTRSDFVANASHELRTPLAGLIGFIETLRGPAADDPPAQQRFLGIMAEQADRMNRLIDDLLNLSRVELSEHRPPAEAVDLAAIIGRTAASFEPRLVARGMTLIQETTPSLPPVLGDADQIAQVIQNLVDNAIKYGRAGGTICVRAASPELREQRWPARPGAILSVADDGPGIERRHLPRLTERFYRVDKGRARNVGGTGLGLAIVKHIVNRHRGQLAIESDLGQGVTVRIWLPCIDRRAALRFDAAERAPRPMEAAPAGRR